MNCGLILAISTLITLGGLAAETSIKIKSFHGVCPGKKNLPMVYSEFKLERNGDGKTMCTLAIDAKEDVVTPLKGELVIQRCNKNGQQCVTIKKIKYNNYCESIASNSSPFAQIYQNMKPRWACPIKKGIHKVTRRVLDTKFLAVVANDRGLWKTKMELFDKDGRRQFLCVDSELYFE